ncbi:hypothetical protein GCM10011583_73690 [Streptomyces camponoticapitis]|uniref:SH3 domain-containing protein n=1 Tax=Streptomyces camponoticapitis TaxID=1616125 RepID=A0ABQ2EXE7_9ACTN|nr:hypothetical protein [Streptomyces camponoticapitis]GGK31097.1 hypothetical protein GCM10011583_73690 [Streptomyces camponoticapitis]
MRISSALAAVSLTIGLSLAATVPAGAADTVTSGLRPAVVGKGEGDVSVKRAFTTWATNVNVRHNNSNFATCNNSPSAANCPNVRGQVNPGVSFEAWCQKIGSQTVGGNPYWVYVILPSFEGWMASYYVDYPDNVLPDTPFC